MDWHEKKYCLRCKYRAYALTGRCPYREGEGVCKIVGSRLDKKFANVFMIVWGMGFISYQILYWCGVCRF